MKPFSTALIILSTAGMAACANGPARGALESEPAEAPVFREAPAPSRPHTLFLAVEGSFAEAEKRLRRALSGRALSVFAVVDHGENARKAGLSLPPTKLYIFGNPKAGTPFMAADARMALELPMRMALSERDGNVRVTWPDMKGVARSYGISDAAAPVGKVSENLRLIAEEVAFAPKN
ncbi:MAG: DUF302 domain-containing protein [Alphaproteobacteria bacterium]|jgi:uncharacterized protein (DUF302 family)|nr:DUF302 domain-containing protein [Alphaproteobacteria bacterium]